MITVQDLCKAFGRQKVLKGISTRFEQGKTNLIIGQSGSGKTVFMKCLLGLAAPTSGQIHFDGTDYQSMSGDQRAALRSAIGTVFQGSALFDSMNVEENVRFPLEMFKRASQAEMKKRVHEVLERVNLSGQHKKLPSELSGGMKKRVAIARAVVARPKYLFCDEPNSGLDPKTAIVIDNLIQEITQEYNTTTIINTHDMNSVLEIGQKIIYLKDGVKAWEGDYHSILSDDNQAIREFVCSSNLMHKVKDAFSKVAGRAPRGGSPLP